MKTFLTTLFLFAITNNLVFTQDAYSDNIYEEGKKSGGEELITLFDVARPRPEVPGGHSESDIPMRILRPRGTGKSSIDGTLDAIRRFHATRLEWTYLNEGDDPIAYSELIPLVQEMGVTFGGAKGRNGYIGDVPSDVWNIVDLDEKSVLTNHDGPWGCINHPEFRTGQLRYVKALVDAGVDVLQRDDPKTLTRAMNDGGACFCDYCMESFNKWLVENADEQILNELGVADLEAFDYREYLIARGAPVGKEFNDWTGDELKTYFHQFQADSEVEYHQWWREDLNIYAERYVPVSCNNVFDRLDHVAPIFDFWIGELHNSKARPDYLYSNMQRVYEYGKTQTATIPLYHTDEISEDWIRHIRQTMATLYAIGGNMEMPWDTYISGNPRFFGDPADYADLSGFIRAMAPYLDGYADAAAYGAGIEDERWTGDEIPVQILSITDEVYAFTRVKPEDENAPVVIHLVNWSEESKPVTIGIDPRRFFGDQPVKVTLVNPPEYNYATHYSAEYSGDYGDLAIFEVLEEGRITNIEVPEFNTWSVLLVEPVNEAETLVWQPIISSAGYYSNQLEVQITSPYEGVEIYYTLDGSNPTQEDFLYTSPFMIEETGIVRARSYDGVGNSSKVSNAEFKYLDQNEIMPDVDDLSANLKLWLRAEALDLEDEDFVFEWTADAGPSATLQSIMVHGSVSAAPPIYRTNSINGMPAICFEEANHSLAIPGFANDYLAGKEFTIFMVNSSEDNEFGIRCNQLNGGPSVPRFYVQRKGITYGILALAQSDAPEEQPVLNTYAYSLEETPDTVGYMHVYVNGEFKRNPKRYLVEEFGAGGNLVIPIATTLGNMSEIIIFDRMLNDIERTGIESYLAGKYAIGTVPRWARTTPVIDPVYSDKIYKASELLRIYPNPGNGSLLYIDMLPDLKKDILLKIYNFKGEEFFNKKIVVDSNHLYELRLNPKLSPGLYIFHVLIEGQNFIEKYISVW